MILIWALKS